VSREDQRGGNGPVPGTRRKAVLIAMTTGPARIDRRATRAAGETDEPGRHGALGTKLGTRRTSPAI
jgi:hypothetical protein